MTGDIDHGELRYQITLTIGPCFEDDAEELADILTGIAERDPWNGSIALRRWWRTRSIR